MSIRRPWQMQEESWKFRWLRPCLVKEEAKVFSGNRNDNWLHLQKTRGRDLVVLWNLMNPQGHFEQNYLNQSIMKITLQAEDTHRWVITIWFISLSRCRKRWRFQLRKQQWTKNEKSSTIPAWKLEKVRSKKEVILEAQRDKKKSPLCFIDGHVSLEKKRSWNRNFWSTIDVSYSVVTLLKWLRRFCCIHRARIVCVTNDCGKNHGCNCRIAKAADAVSAYTQVKFEDAPRLLRIPKSECPDIWIRLPRDKWPTSWSSMEDPVVLLDRNLYGHPLAGLLWERPCEELSSKLGREKVPNWECLSVQRKQGLFLSVYVDDLKKKRLERSRIWLACERNWWKTLICEKPASFFDHVCLGSTQRECKPNVNHLLRNTQKMFESRISAGATEKMLGWKKLTQKHVDGKNDTHKQWHWKDTVNWRTRKLSNCTKFQAPAWMTINSRKRNLNLWRIVRSVLTYCVEMLVPGTNWTTGYFMVCQQTGSCCYKMDSSMRQTFSKTYFMHSSYTRLPTTLSRRATQHTKTQTLLVTLRTRNQHQGEPHAHPEVEHSSLWMGCVRNKTSVSHSSSESEIVSLDAGLRMDGLLALDLWDIVIQVLRSPQDEQETFHHSFLQRSQRDTQSPTKRQKPKSTSNCLWQRGRTLCWSIVSCGSRAQHHNVLKVIPSCTFLTITKR